MPTTQKLTTPQIAFLEAHVLENQSYQPRQVRTARALAAKGLVVLIDWDLPVANLTDAGREALGIEAPAVVEEPARETISVSIAGPNLVDQSKGNFVVHAAGCADIAKMARRDPMYRDDMIWTIDAASAAEVGDGIYSDHINEGSMEPGEGQHDCHFAPCCRFLSGTKAPAAKTGDGQPRLTNSQRRALRLLLRSDQARGSKLAVKPFEYFVEVGYAKRDGDSFQITDAGAARAATIPAKYDA